MQTKTKGVPSTAERIAISLALRKKPAKFVRRDDVFLNLSWSNFIVVSFFGFRDQSTILVEYPEAKARRCGMLSARVFVFDPNACISLFIARNSANDSRRLPASLEVAPPPSRQLDPQSLVVQSDELRRLEAEREPFAMIVARDRDWEVAVGYADQPCDIMSGELSDQDECGSEEEQQEILQLLQQLVDLPEPARRSMQRDQDDHVLALMRLLVVVSDV